MDYSIGERIKDLREHLKMSQKDLCKNICTQGLISRIERSTTIPTAPLLHQLALRLGVDLNYFFDDISRNGINYVQEVKLTINKLIHSHDYHEIMKIVQLEKKNPLFRESHLQQYLLWREGICIYHLEKDSEKALSFLDKALQVRPGTNHTLTEIEVDILASKAIVFSKINDLGQAAAIYEHIFRKIGSFPNFKNKRLLIRVLYNASRNAFDRQNYKESLSYADKALNICIEEEHLYLLGNLFYLKGCTLFRHDRTQKATSLKLLHHAWQIYQLNPIPVLINSLEEEIAYVRTS
ncbi:helix-turn-helix domain-containing protein [Bacillus sp. FJAT-45037]|uniref:helix-turn-helix domain-containing protein n=1 Tax=Bacillus sp. FJAT-45037 TaxID=2011007 RepID=UPI000C234D91|nr:helix-turn-helix domain-containing protein [Bacillus sp. FJAT-45037]